MLFFCTLCETVFSVTDVLWFLIFVFTFRLNTFLLHKLPFILIFFHCSCSEFQVLRNLDGLLVRAYAKKLYLFHILFRLTRNFERLSDLICLW